MAIDYGQLEAAVGSNTSGANAYGESQQKKKNIFENAFSTLPGDVADVGKGMWNKTKDSFLGGIGRIGDAGEGYATGKYNMAESAARGVAGAQQAVLSPIIGVAGQGIENLVIDPVKKAYDSFTSEETKQNNSEYVGQKAQEISEWWKTQSPEQQRALENAGVGIELLTNMVGGNAVKKKAGALLAEGATGGEGNAVGNQLVKTGENIISKAEQKELEKTMEIVKAKLSKSEQQKAYKKGKGQKTGITGEVSVKNDKELEEIAKASHGIVKGKNEFEDIDNLRSAIDDSANKVDELAAEFNKPISNLDVKNALDSVEPPFALVGDSEKVYAKVKNGLMKIVQNNSDDTVGLLKARREFDEMVAEQIPNLYDQEGKTMRKAVQDLRAKLNDMVADGIPEDGNGNLLKAELRKQHNMFKAVDNIAEKASEVGSTKFGKYTKYMESHPFITLGAMAGTGFGGMYLGLLTSPVAIASLATYGTYKLGKTVVTSTGFRKFIGESLITLGKGLGGATTFEEKMAIKKQIENLKGMQAEFDKAAKESTSKGAGELKLGDKPFDPAANLDNDIESYFAPTKETTKPKGYSLEDLKKTANLPETPPTPPTGFSQAGTAIVPKKTLTEQDKLIKEFGKYDKKFLDMLDGGKEMTADDIIAFKQNKKKLEELGISSTKASEMYESAYPKPKKIEKPSTAPFEIEDAFKKSKDATTIWSMDVDSPYYLEKLEKEVSVKSAFKQAGIKGEDMKTLFSYTMNGYERLNQMLRGEKPMVKPYVDKFLHHLKSALDKLPKHTKDGGASHRYISDKYKKSKYWDLEPGDTYTEVTPQSTSVTKSYEDKHQGAVNFYIESSKSGKNIAPFSNYGGETEVLFMPGTKWKVVKKELDSNFGLSLFIEEI